MVPFGSESALTLLGITTDGGSIRFERKIREVKSDAAGEAPADLQIMGETATIRLKLSSWDATFVEECVRRGAGSLTNDVGEAGDIGTFLFNNSAGQLSHSLYLPGGSDDPWFFPNVILRAPNSQTLSTKFGEVELEFFAWRAFAPDQQSVGSDALYTNEVQS
ncbi:hypothetical protein FRUB_02112 [Fimbriiglobus ruber]|uniref:Uncharacterized protein n=2 Tax=Fimbriiglobus ruber TaxID=1908690 RepID=A0A225DWQ3_9BACT|nr:hypothetical protein FRUB_02112 [Fimbriiglobus ruber]